MTKEIINIPTQLREKMISVDELVPYDKNPRKHGERGINELCNAIREHGFNQPILIDQHNRIVAGHGRRLAAMKLKMEKVPFILAYYENDAEYIKNVLSDNKVAEFSKWDAKLMKDVGEILEEIDGADFSIAGFSNEDIDKMFGHSYKETLETTADFGDSGDVDVMDETTRVTSMTFKMSVTDHKRIKATMEAVMRENDFETTGEALIFMTSKFKGPGKTIRRTV
jgi:hypothetical protein